MLKHAALTLLCLAILSAAASAQAMDPARSTVTVLVKKAGFFSAFGHDHVIRAPIRQGRVDTAARTVSLSFASADLQVMDRDASLKDQAEIRRTMLGPQVLDAAGYPEIRFHSTSVEPLSEARWRVQGELTLHGVTRPLLMEVASGGGQYGGRARLKQTDFGIKPVSFAGGTVKVKDEVVIEFEIHLVQEQGP